jgi:hypothetical protein
MEPEIRGETSGRRSLSSGSQYFMIAIEFLALLACRIFVGLDTIFLLQFSVLAVFGLGFNAAMAMLLGNLGIGIYAAHLLAGLPPLWVSSLLGGFASLMLAFRFVKSTNSTTGDVNPIAYMLAIAVFRSYLATFYSSIASFDSFDSNFLTWLTVFVIGIIPGWPVIANVVSAIILNGSLIYLVLLLKRIANPVAN